MTAHVTQPTAEPLAQLPPWVRLVLAPNPGPMTLEGTNTWVLRSPQGDAVVVDPGPLDEGHLTAVAASGHIRTVITTHHHIDHTEGVARLLELCPGATLWQPAGDDDAGLRLPGLELRLSATPGHTADSVTLVGGVGEDRVVLTGDTILGRGTTVVAHPDGDLADYLQSLRLLELLGPVPVLPGHGPALTDCGAAAAFYLRHRLARLDQVRAARLAGASTASEVVKVVYADVDPQLWPAAELSVRAQLTYLEAYPGHVSPAPQPHGAPAREAHTGPEADSGP